MKSLYLLVALFLLSCGDIENQMTDPAVGSVMSLKDMGSFSADEQQIKAQLCGLMVSKKSLYDSSMLGAVVKYDSSLSDCGSEAQSRDISLQVESQSGQFILNGSNEDLRFGFRYVELIQANSFVNSLCTSGLADKRYIDDEQVVRSFRLKSQANAVTVIYGDLVAQDGQYRLMHREEIVYNTRNTSTQPLGVVLQRSVESLSGCQSGQFSSKSLKFQGYSRL